MKRFVIAPCVLLALSASPAFAVPPAPVQVAQTGVPTGTYETYFLNYSFALEKFLGGDIEILPGGKYRYQGKTGTFRLSGGQVEWQSGPLQGVVTRYQLDRKGKPALLIPYAENKGRADMKAASDIWGYLR